jgi:hypothetical protein
MLQTGRSRVRVPIRWIFFNWPNPSSRTMALGSTQPGSWVRIALRAWMFDVCVPAFFCVCVLLCLGRGLATSWSPVQGVLPSVNDQETKKSSLSSKKWEQAPKWEERGRKKVHSTCIRFYIKLTHPPLQLYCHHWIRNMYLSHVHPRSQLRRR